MLPTCCIQTKDCLNRSVIFEEENRKRHSNKHPELNDRKFLEKVKKTIECPQKIFPSKFNRRCLCYYRLENFQDDRWGRFSQYTKVVILKGRPFKVKTAHYSNTIREEGDTWCIYQNKNI